jgi:hypothetical protein
MTVIPFLKFYQLFVEVDTHLVAFPRWPPGGHLSNLIGQKFGKNVDGA